MSTEKKSKTKKTRKAALLLLIKLGTIAAVIWIMFQFVITARIWHDNTMFPTIRDGELVLFKRFGEWINDDIILYTAEGEEHIGRIVAVAGDVVKIDEGGVQVNGTYRMDSNPYPTPPSTNEEVIVGPEEVYVLADYREEMNDSRLLGCIPREHIIGEIFFTMRYRGL